MKENYIVKKSNHFIMNTSFDLSLEEQKIVLALASMVQPDDDEFTAYKFRVSDFLELLGIENQSLYSEIPKITKGLMKKVLEIDEENSILQVAWLNSARYIKGSGEVILKFSSELKPYMILLKEKFTQYQLSNVLSMKSKYSIRLYEILKCNAFKKQGFIEIEIEELRRLVKAELIYIRYYDFKKRIILQAQDEINTLTDISFEFEEIKTGRNITSIKFFITSKKTVRQKHINITTSIPEISHAEPIYNVLNHEIENFLSDKDTTDLKRTFKDMFNVEIADTDVEMLLNKADGNVELIKEQMKYAANYPNHIKSLIGFIISGIEKEFKPKQKQPNYKNDNRDNVPQMRNYEERDGSEYEDIIKNLYKIGSQ